MTGFLAEREEAAPAPARVSKIEKVLEKKTEADTEQKTRPITPNE